MPLSLSINRPEDFVSEQHREELVGGNNDDDDEFDSALFASRAGWFFPVFFLAALGYAWYSKKEQIARSGRHKKIDA